MDECTRVRGIILMEADNREYTVHVPFTDEAESRGLRGVGKILSTTTSIRYRLHRFVRLACSMTQAMHFSPDREVRTHVDDLT